MSESVTIDGFLSDPVSTVQQIFHSFIESSGISSLKQKNNNFGAVEILSSLFHLNDPNATLIERIPSLNVQNVLCSIPNKSLVRYRCMIQNTLNPEYYLGVYCERSLTGTLVIRTGKYCEAIVVSPGHTMMDHSADTPQIPDQRIILNCVPIPGEAFWIKKELNARSIQVNYRQQRRQQEQNSGSKKRKRENEINNKGDQNDTEMMTEKKSFVSDGNDVHDDINITVKVCGSNMTSFKVGDIVEFVGIVTGIASKNTILHSIDFRKLNQQTGYPPLRPTLQPSTLQPSAISDARSSLLQYIACVCGEDSLVAELLLLHMVSRVYFRQQDKSIGKLCVNILVPSSTLPSPCIPLSQLIYRLYSTLLPRVKSLVITCDNVNNQRFMPKKDYETDQLLSGKLQTAAETFIICDETNLQSGNVKKMGVKNLDALKKLASLQLLDYDFTYNTITFKQDNAILVLSKKKCLSVNPDIYIPIQSKNASSFPLASVEQLNVWRKYLQLTRRTKFTLSDSAGNMVSESFVKMRQTEGRSKVTEDNFHLLMTLARLLMNSRLVESLNPQGWSDTQTLFKAIQDRCANA